MFIRRSFNFLQFPWLEKFISACKKIEKDPNYQPNITDEELFDLVAYKNGRPKHMPVKTAVALQPTNIKAISAEGESLGAVYQIKETCSFDNDGDPSDPIVSHVSTSHVILVNKKGEYSLHSRENAEKGNFNAPLCPTVRSTVDRSSAAKHQLVTDSYLNQECIHYPESQPSTIINFNVGK